MTDANTKPAASAIREASDPFVRALAGFALLLVVIGTVIQRTFGVSDFGVPSGMAFLGGFDQWTAVIFAFGYWSMPLLFACAGWLACSDIRRPFREWLGGKAAALLVPFLTWQLVYFWLADRFVHKTGNLIDFIWYTTLHPGNGLMYLAILFVFYLLAAAALSTGTGEWGLLLVGIALAALPSSQTMGVAQMQAYWPFFGLGYIAAANADVVKRFRFFAMGAGVVLYGLALWGLYAQKSPAFQALVAVGGVAVATTLMWALAKIPRVEGAFAFLGDRVVEVYAIHFVFAILPLWMDWGRVAIVSAVAVAGSLGVAWFLRREPLFDVLFLGGRHAWGDVFGPRGQRAEERRGKRAGARTEESGMSELGEGKPGGEGAAEGEGGEAE